MPPCSSTASCSLVSHAPPRITHWTIETRAYGPRKEKTRPSTPSGSAVRRSVDSWDGNTQAPEEVDGSSDSRSTGEAARNRPCRDMPERRVQGASRRAAVTGRPGARTGSRHTDPAGRLGPFCRFLRNFHVAVNLHVGGQTCARRSAACYSCRLAELSAQGAAASDNYVEMGGIAPSIQTHDGLAEAMIAISNLDYFKPAAC